MCPTDGSASDYCLICPTDGSALPAFLKPWSTVQLYISIETQHDFLLPKGYPTHPNTPSPFSPPQIPYSTHINDYPTWTITNSAACVSRKSTLVVKSSYTGAAPVENVRMSETADFYVCKTQELQLWRRSKIEALAETSSTEKVSFILHFIAFLSAAVSN